MNPKDKAEAIVSRMFIKLGGSYGKYNWNPIVYQNTLIHNNAKKVCEAMVTEIMISKMIDLTDEQVCFWRKVQDEIQKL